MNLIHKDTHDWSLGPRWTVTQDPTMNGSRDLVGFLKQGQRRKLLDQVARWDGRGWDPSRWVPTFPQVPRTLLAIVERHMTKTGVPAP